MRKARVLIADDDPSFRALTARMLRADYWVIPAADGREAVEKALAVQPEAIVMDLDMPGCSGLEVIQHIRAIPRLRTTPIIVLSADGQRDTVVSVIAGGGDDYLLKDSISQDPELLACRLRSHLRRAELRVAAALGGAADPLPQRRAD